MKRTETDFKYRFIPDKAKLLGRKLVFIGEYTAIYEQWIFDGIKTESLIFCREDVSHLTEAGLKHLCIEAGYLNQPDDPDDFLILRSQHSGYAIVSFNSESGY